jgi:polyisoprenoid-binding protein YceI
MKRRTKQVFTIAAMPLSVFLVALFLGAMPRHATPLAPDTQLTLKVDPSQSNVHWTLGTTLHTVHGTFAVKGGTIHVDLPIGKAQGEIVILATSGVSGNDARDRKMHREVLESERFPDILFQPDRIDGKLVDQGASDFQLHGTFALRGSEHELTVPVHTELSGDHWAGTAKFKIPFLVWGLKDPSNFLLKVKREVEIDLELKGSFVSSSAGKF